MDEVLIPLGIMAIIFSVPLVAILTKHQQKMAQILSERPATIPADQAQMMQEMAELRQLVHQQAIQIDDLTTMHRRFLENSETDTAVRSRLSSN